ncbi:MAG: Zn-dependent oligopeptidase [Chloroflexi bacterium]|nr:Zn-dependent oligopeptidase [Chloroflexota bacterium]
MAESETTFDYRIVTAERVARAAAEAIARADATLDGIVARSAAPNAPPPTFDETLRALDDALEATSSGYGVSAFMGHVHSEHDVRDAGTAAEERLAKWRVELPFREDLYRAVKAFAATPEGRGLTGESARLLEHWIREFQRAGQDLPAADREALRALRARLVELEVQFQRNIAEYRDHLELTREELDGLPDGYVERLRPGAIPGTFQVSLDYPEVVPFMEEARRRDLREELERREWNKAVEANRPVLGDALAVRRRIAVLLGYPSWAHYAMAVRMAREPDAVRTFYRDLIPAVSRAAEAEIARLRAALQAETGDDDLRPWDVRYYDNQIRRREYGVDPAVVSEYFPLEPVIDGMLDLTGDVFGLDYRHVPDPRSWHPGVRLFEIRDRGSGVLLAHAYMDLFPREGKFSHAAAFSLVVARRTTDGARKPAVSAIVANFTPATRDRPALLRHDEVLTLFHEWGHILHMSLSQAEFVRFSGAETESDFVEAPSQIMEHWSWDPGVLGRFARHYETGEPIPTALVEKLVGARNLNVAVKTLRQAYFGEMDLAFHGEDEPTDLDAINRASFAVTGLPFHEGTFFAAGFGHLVGGYDAGYYGYLWSKVYGDDMFSRFEAEGITSPTVGVAYRREILEPGGSADAEQLLRRFLGREPSNAAFLRQLGLAAS